jgi:hydroxymethylglutaryl-CoA lyase
MFAIQRLLSGSLPERTALIHGYAALRVQLLHNLRSISVPDSVRIVEVGPRDGLQNEASMVSVDDKVTLITMLADAGCSYIEAGSFVSPKAVPAMQNSLDVMKRLAEPNWRKRRSPDLVLSCLVPTVKYFQNAIDVKANEIAIFGSASETFSQKVRIPCLCV